MFSGDPWAHSQGSMRIFNLGISYQWQSKNMYRSIFLTIWWQPHNQELSLNSIVFLFWVCCTQVVLLHPELKWKKKKMEAESLCKWYISAKWRPNDIMLWFHSSWNGEEWRKKWLISQPTDVWAWWLQKNLNLNSEYHVPLWVVLISRKQHPSH